MASQALWQMKINWIFHTKNIYYIYKMKTLILIIMTFCPGIMVSAGIVEKTFYFHDFRIDTIGTYQTVNFGNTSLSGFPGEPLLPYHEIFLMLPPGEVAVSINVTGENEITLPGRYILYPQQPSQPISKGSSGEFIKDEKVYAFDGNYPAKTTGKLMTQFLNGYAFALSTVTPVNYNPAKGKLSYYRKVTVRIKTLPGSQSQLALMNLPFAEKIRKRVKMVAQNPEMMTLFPEKDSPLTNYDYLIISPLSFKNEFQPLISMYSGKGISIKIATTDSILTYVSGSDLTEKIRNLIINQYQTCGIEYVLLAGNPALVPCRGFYCYVVSGSGYTDLNIPADLYFSGLDGNYNADEDDLFGEVVDDPDLLPDIAVGRFTVNDTAELHRMIQKSVSYQTNPVLGEMTHPLLAGEYLWGNPLTFGGDFMDLLIDDHADSGYFTHGIPSATNDIVKLYDSLKPTGGVWQWTSAMLLEKINQGNSFIHHLGHSNTTYMMRLAMSSITNSNFASVNGIIHNYQLLYTQGCYCGAFDDGGGCIAAKAVTINNFLVAGIFNSRYGWFNEGSSNGPSQHLHREFVSALYNDTVAYQIKELGAAHMMSKIKTAPFIGLPGEWEPGAQRWCHYCCNVFGDPAMEIWTEEPTAFTEIVWTGNLDSDWMKSGNWNLSKVPTSLNNVTIPVTSHDPVITTSNSTFCHDLTILDGGKITVDPGKSMIVRGTVTLSHDK